MERNEENLSHDEQRVAELIGTLRQVDAPANFDTRVRARIAERRGGKSAISWRPVLAGVVAVAVLAFVGFLVLRSLNSGAGTPPREIANAGAAAPTPVAPNQSAIAAPTPAATQDNPSSIAATKPPMVNNNAVPRQSGGSFDEAMKGSRTLSPRTLDPSPRRPNDTGALGGQIPVTMLFEAIGVHASWSAGGWRVDSVDSKNVAGRAGIKQGDVIEALDGQPVGEKTTFKAVVTGKSVRVRRDGTVLDLPFK